MRILGLHLDPPYVSAALFETAGKKGKIDSLQPMILATPDNVKQFYIQKAPQSTSIAFATLVRKLHFELSSLKQIQKILPFQVESLSSLSLQEIAFTNTYKPAKTGTESTIFFTSKESLQKILEEWQTRTIVPDRAVSTFTSLLNFSKHFFPNLSSGFIIDLGSQKWTCVWIENGEVKKGFTIDQGIEPLLAALWEDLKKVLFQKEIEGVAAQMDLLQLKHHLHPHLSSKLEQARNALANVLYSFQQECGAKPVVFTGRADAFTNLPSYLLGPFSELTLEDMTFLSSEEQKCAIAIGCALEQNLQFLNKEFTPKKAWEKAGCISACLLFASVSLSALLLITGHAKFQAKKEQIGASFKTVLKESDAKLAKTLFLGDVEKGIEQAALAIQKYDKETPYILQSPNVTEVLAWVSSHPLIDALRTTTDPLEVVSIKYQLVSFPHIEALKDPYRAKVDLEFQVKSPMNARKFHEALLQDTDFVDAEEELLWDSSGDTYRTSFYLKNKASHVR